MSAFAIPLILLSSLAQTPAPRDLVARAVGAMGGAAAVRGIRNYTITFYSSTFAPGPEETPQSPPRATITTGTQTTDYAGSRQVSGVEIRNPAGAVNKQRRITAGDIGMLETNGVQAPDGPGAVANVERNWRRSIERVLIAALDNPTALRSVPARTWRGEAASGVRYANGPDTLNIYFDRRSGLPVLTEVLADDPILGDRRTVQAFTRWQPAGDIVFARQFDTEVNGRFQTNTVVTSLVINGAVADSLFVIPDSIKSRAQPGNPNPPPVTVTLVELAPNVWRAEGGSHHSLIVDQGARLVLIEAPLGAQRMEAVLDTLRSRFPGKPVGVAINTHHHWDHSGGLRAVLAAGVPVITHARNAGFVRSIATAPKTVRPDVLSRRLGPARSRPPTISVVEDSLVVGTGDSRVVAYRLPTAHAEGVLAIYVPSAGILFQSDVVTANPNPPPLGSAELVKFVQARGITVERVAGGHGQVVAWDVVQRAAAPPPTSAP